MRENIHPTVKRIWEKQRGKDICTPPSHPAGGKIRDFSSAGNMVKLCPLVPARGSKSSTLSCIYQLFSSTYGI